MTRSWKLNSNLLCWAFDSKKNHEMEYDSRILVSSVNLVYLDFQCAYRYECLVLESTQGNDFRKILLWFTDAGLSWIKSERKQARKPLICGQLFLIYSWTIASSEFWISSRNFIIQTKKPQWIQRVSVIRLVTFLGLWVYLKDRMLSRWYMRTWILMGATWFLPAFFVGVAGIWCACRVVYSVVIWYARCVTYTVGIPYVRRVTSAVGTWYARRVTYSVGIWCARHVTYFVNKWYVRRVTYFVGI